MISNRGGGKRVKPKIQTQKQLKKIRNNFNKNRKMNVVHRGQGRQVIVEYKNKNGTRSKND